MKMDKMLEIAMRCNEREEKRKQKEREEKQLNLKYEDLGWRKQGITPKGRYWTFDPNEEGDFRSNRWKHCGTLIIEHKLIFTSGTFAKAIEIIAKS